MSRSKGHVPIERSYIYHKEYSYEISKLWHSLFQVSSKVNVSDRFTE